MASDGDGDIYILSSGDDSDVSDDIRCATVKTEPQSNTPATGSSVLKRKANFNQELLANSDNVPQPACFSKQRINGKIGRERKGYLMMIRASVTEKDLLSTKHPEINRAVREIIRDLDLHSRSFPKVYKDFATVIHNKRNYMNRKQKRRKAERGSTQT